MAEIASPAQSTLEAHLSSVRFLVGADSGRWILQGLAWPYIHVRVRGRDPESGRTFAHDYRLECSGFPDPGPFVERWLYGDSGGHGHKPSAPSAGSPGYLDAMKEWGGGDIYRAWSRVASTHNNWAGVRPDEAWHPKRSIVFCQRQSYFRLIPAV